MVMSQNQSQPFSTSLSFQTVGMSSEINSKILEIKKDHPVHDQGETTLTGYQTAKDLFGRIAYVKTEIYQKDLDNGFDPTIEARSLASSETKEDIPAQFIGKNLGGDGYIRNTFAMNKLIDFNPLMKAQSEMYEFIKAKDSRYVVYELGIEYPDPDDEFSFRPTNIYFHYTLYETDKAIDPPREGVFVNTLPEGAHDDFFDFM